MADEDFEMVLMLPKPVGQEELKIQFGEEFNRRPTALDDLMEDLWQRALKRNPKTFDGSKFRLGAIAEGPDVIELSLGLTGYREYLATNQLDQALFDGLVGDGKAGFRDPNAHLSNALGCEAMLITSDDQAVFLRRSSQVATHSGLYNGPSGHPEPKKIGLPAEGREAIRFFQGTEEEMPTQDAIRKELFDSVIEEIVSETNVPAEQLSPPLFMACMRDSRRKPDVIFLVRASITADEVRKFYEEGAEEGWESDRLAFVPTSALSTTSLPFTTVTRAAIEAFKSL